LWGVESGMIVDIVKEGRNNGVATNKPRGAGQKRKCENSSIVVYNLVVEQQKISFFFQVRVVAAAVVVVFR
jgi:hypothetical protein